MSFTIKYYPKIAIATFKSEVKSLEPTNAFVELVETGNIKKIDYIIFDFTDITAYTVPEDYMERVKFVTEFSVSWNSNIDVIIIATNPEIRFMITAYINHKDNLKWKYHLFNDMESAKKIFPEI
ncbi:MAG: hypothetical protein COB73_02185 [Flavobacteriaceae bacterium]|nr:MAG: hypothetical protein COB73_02185 [Flavobacteriaceae bacterium]